jgi:hypothetical protein
MAEIEGNQLINPSPEANPPSRAELERAEQNIIAHLEGAGLESVRWKAFTDFVDREEAFVQAKGDQKRTDVRLAIIDETIRQRKNELKGYKKEYGLLGPVIREYRVATEEYESKNSWYKNNLKKTDMDKYREYTKDEDFPEHWSQVCVRGLQRLKEQELDKISQ